tara:strand:- start:7522 stop:8442 length:921 start_codon:yes stop_codon:yes gene_type:complete
MRITALLNAESGTLKTTDIGGLCDHIENSFSEKGHAVSCQIAGAGDFTRLLSEAAASDADVILTAGGDGSISSAASHCWKNKKCLAVVPAGTMNLFARSLGIPLDLHEAVTALADGRTTFCDIATANGRPFVHQYSVGMQPKLAEVRKNYEYNSRLAKIFASLRALTSQLSRPPSVHAKWTIDDQLQEERVSIIAVSNNPYGEGHLPYADDLQGGVLGVYTAKVLNAAANMKLAASLMAGTWASNPDFHQQISQQTIVEFARPHRTRSALIDGELIALENKVVIRSLPKALQVLVPGSIVDASVTG